MTARLIFEGDRIEANHVYTFEIPNYEKWPIFDNLANTTQITRDPPHFS